MAVRQFSSCFGSFYSKTCFRVARRGFCSGKPSDVSITKLPFSQPLPGMPAPKYATSRRGESRTQVTTLENGMRVASDDNYGAFMTIGVLIDSGSRYEVKHPSGISHFLEKLAFGATDKFSSRDEILQSLEGIGGICDAQGSRDTLIYAMSMSNDGAEKSLDVLSETVLRPRFTELEMEETKRAIKYELMDLQDTPEPEQLMMELYHQAAYRDNTLGLPRYAPENTIDDMTSQHLLSYMRCYHRPERMVLAGVGVAHDSLVALARKYFVGRKPVWEERHDLIDVTQGFDDSTAQYTGGLIKVEKDMTQFSFGPSPMPNLVHSVIGLESFSHKDEQFIATCVLHSLMGGGGSFSAGGPGKGMYTRLYLNVLNQCHWMYNATAQSHAYNDSGTFCIHVSAEPSYIRTMFEVIIQQLLLLREERVGKVELSRAKAQLKSQLLMNLESRPVMFEDLGRQILAYNLRRSAEYYITKIDAVTEEDIRAVASHLLASRPSVAVLGDTSNCPSMEDFELAFSSKREHLRKGSKIFGKFSI